MIDSTLNLWDNSTIYNISTIATTKSTVEELNTTEISLTPLHNVAVRQSTNHSGNILEFINLILPSSTTTQTARTSENEINVATQIGKCLLIYDIEMRCHYNVPITIIPRIILIFLYGYQRKRNRKDR